MSNQDQPVELPAGDAFYLDAPERFRSRARSMAGLLATGAVALVAGLAFSTTSRQLGRTTITLGLLCVFLLVVSVVSFGAASVYTKKGSDDESQLDASSRLSGAIHNRIRFGSWAAGLAAIAFLATSVSAVVEPPEQANVDVYPAGPYLAALRVSCPILESPFDATVAQPDLIAERSTIAVEIEDRACTDGGTHAEVTLFLKRDSVLIVEAESAS